MLQFLYQAKVAIDLYRMAGYQGIGSIQCTHLGQ